MWEMTALLLIMGFVIMGDKAIANARVPLFPIQLHSGSGGLQPLLPVLSWSAVTSCFLLSVVEMGVVEWKQVCRPVEVF